MTKAQYFTNACHFNVLQIWQIALIEHLQMETTHNQGRYGEAHSTHETAACQYLWEFWKIGIGRSERI